MSGLELSLGQKLQAAFVVVVLVIAGMVFFHDSRPAVDMTINAWTQPHYIGLDPKRPVGARNPVDPARTTKITTFAFHDGRLEIEEYPASTGLKAEFRFIKDNHRTTYDFYKDPLAWTKKMNPFDRAIATAVYSADANPNRLLQLLRSATLDDNQRKAEKDARDLALNQFTLMEEGAKTGNYHPEMYEKVLQALAIFKAKGGDPSKNAAAAQRAHNVVDLATGYLAKLDSEKDAVAQKYVSTMDGLLKDDQKTKLSEAYKQIESYKPRMNRRWRGGRSG